jgi:hypothetical protein
VGVSGLIGASILLLTQHWNEGNYPVAVKPNQAAGKGVYSFSYQNQCLSGTLHSKPDIQVWASEKIME